VFTSKVCSSNASLFATPNSDHDCLRCQLWNITNPGEDLRCEDCVSEASASSATIVRVPGQSETIPVAIRLDTVEEPPSQSLPRSKGTARCSACEISALIHPGQSTNCTSCTPDTEVSFQPRVSKPSEVRRSCARRPPTKLESHATRCLHQWLKENRNNPYPDNDTKRLLATKCGITEKQVNTWFTNARARRRVIDTSLSNPASEDEDSRETRLSSVTSTTMSNEALFDHHGPIVAYCPAEGSNQTGIVTSRRGKKKDYGQSSSIRLAAHQGSVAQSASLLASKNNDDGEKQTWQCTFCYQHIARKSWRRHEETQHRPKRKWTCLLSGPRITLPSRSDNVTLCVFCMISSPSDLHFAQCHRIAECITKGEDERTFLRPDHLRQHVRNFHKAKLDETIRDLWRREGPGNTAVENWVCGFCEKVLKTWEDRETHIAGHFKDGLTMTNWKGYTREDSGVEARKKRPTSSEGRPNMLSKIARTLTGRPVHQQHHCESHGQNTDNLAATPISMDTTGRNLCLLPELIFDNFMLGVGHDYFDSNISDFTSAYGQDVVSARRRDSAFPGEGDPGFSFDNLAEDTTSEDFSNLDTFGLWYQ
jgi:hypothetical protein